MADAETPAVAVPTLTLTPIEQATLLGLVAARNAVMEQIEGYLTNTLCARLGVHRSRVANVDANTGAITLASDAPKEK